MFKKWKKVDDGFLILMVGATVTSVKVCGSFALPRINSLWQGGANRGKFGHGKVNGVNGMILLPDEWTLPSGLSFTPGNSNWANDYTSGQWEQMEQNGAVFLPAAGYRGGIGVSDAGSCGLYWSSSCSGSSSHAKRVYFYDSYLYSNIGDYRRFGYSVRLVHPAQ